MEGAGSEKEAEKGTLNKRRAGVRKSIRGCACPGGDGLREAGARAAVQ